MCLFQYHTTCKNLYHSYLHMLHTLTFGHFFGGKECSLSTNLLLNIRKLFYNASSHKLLRVEEKEAEDEIYSTYISMQETATLGSKRPWIFHPHVDHTFFCHRVACNMCQFLWLTLTLYGMTHSSELNLMDGFTISFVAQTKGFT
jgi:hypothetical protein